MMQIIDLTSKTIDIVRTTRILRVHYNLPNFLLHCVKIQNVTDTTKTFTKNYIMLSK